MSIAMCLVVAYLNLDYGPMAKAEKRAAETGKLCEKTFSGGEADEDDFSSIEPSKGKTLDLLLPIIVLIVAVVAFMLWTGGFFSTFDLMEAVSLMDGMAGITYGFAVTLVFCVIYYAARRLCGIMEAISCVIVGAKAMIYVILLLALGWTIGGMCDKLGSTDFMVSALQGNLPPQFLPVLLFVLSCAVTFAVGNCWTTWAIMLPMTIPLAVGLDAEMAVCIGAVIGGGTFGNNCSPLSDTAILASNGANVAHMDHIKTQIPYSLTCAIISCVGFVVAGFMGTAAIPMIICFVIFIVAVFILNKFFGGRKYSIEAAEEPPEPSTDV
jgi:Na+/H+ antiporter NhaC